MMIALAEHGIAPDSLIRFGIRRLLKQRLAGEYGAAGPGSSTVLDIEQRKRNLMTELASGPVAVAQQEANDQHYEVPALFYQLALGPHLKYSSGYWGEGVRTLEEAEAAMLALTCERAELKDGQRVLELGCGWGSLSLWMAEHYPQSSFVSVSNSASQRAWIEQQALTRGLKNLTVITADVSSFSAPGKFDRVVSVEMFEHMRNHRELMRRIHSWLVPGGKLFVHIFCHRELFYPFEVEGEKNWMGRYFFTGGVMPSFDLLDRSQDWYQLEQAWQVNGKHYSRTLEAWLDNTDARKSQIMPVLTATYGEAEAKLWLQRWRMFFMACSELFGYGDGTEWFVGHYLFAAE
ncbi:MAG: cyclopropane-fatty-acyl-phospholipid synthase family protein [Alcanivoracaceae bacterium]|nr:cyclopropane-fatty-acyl-phospholipid synthase family protein [Alcanivoracaceae bacterium]